MHVAQNQVLSLVNIHGFLVSFLAPEHKDNAFRVPRYRLNDILCQVFPPLLLMRVGLPSSDGQDRIQQEHALRCPSGQVAVEGSGACEVYICVIDESMVYGLQTRRRSCLPRHTERHPHGLVVLDVGVLAHDHDFEVRVRRLLKRVEDQVLRGKALR